MNYLKAVILAAGKGTRMESDLPKVIHTIEGKSLADYVVEAALGAGVDEICLVIGYEADKVKETIRHKDVQYVLQEQQLGTGHAVICAADFLGEEGDTLVLAGDMPLITAETLKNLMQHHRERGNAVTVLSSIVEDATGYGRIVRDSQGNVVKIVEHKDAGREERQIKEINAAIYVFNTLELKCALEKITTNNVQGEYYLPDTLAIMKDKGLRVDAYTLENAEDISGVNTQEQLAEAAAVIRHRIKNGAL